MSSFVQANSAEGNGTTAVLAYSSNVTSGHLLVVGCSAFLAGSTLTMTISDSQGNTWTRAPASVVNESTGSNLTAGWAIAKTTGACTITVTLSSANDYGIAIGEWSVPNASPADGSNSAGATTGTSISSGSVTSTAAGDIWVSFATDDGTVTFTGPPYSQTAGWTDRGTQQTSVTHMPIVMADFGVGVNTASGSAEQNTWTVSASSGWAGVCLAFKMAGAAAAVQQQLTMLGVGV